MLPKQALYRMKDLRRKTFVEISEEGKLKYPELRTFNNYNLKTFLKSEKGNNTIYYDKLFKLVDAFGCYLVIIPKEDFKFSEHPTALRLDLRDMPIAYTQKECFHCHHPLTHKERSYKCCPYCLKPYIEELDQSDIPEDIPTIEPEEKEITLEERLLSRFNYEV